VHWLAHFLGLDNPSGGFYLFWSGAGADISELAIIGALLGAWRRHNCHVTGCWRLGRHPVDGTPWVVCKIHHPDDPPTAATILNTRTLTEPTMPKITDELHNLVTALEAEGHTLANKARAILTKLRGDEQQLASDAKADATQIATDARPVMQEAQDDAEQLAAEVKTDAQNLATPPAP
jgi:hypothetical protein